MPQAAPTSDRSPRAFFEEPILVKYSPHHELPLSSVSSLGIHALVIGLIVLAGVLIARLRWGGAEKPLPVEAVTMEPAGGGGGHPQGVGNGPGNEPIRTPEGEEALSNPDDHRPIDPVRKTRLEQARNEMFQRLEFQDPQGQRLMQEDNDRANAWLDLSAGVREKLNRALGGKDGPRPGPGSGDKEGPGRGNADRLKRTLRWTLIFNTRDGRDYKRQLRAFGAIIAVPDPQNADGYLVIRDLDPDRPAARAEDVSKLDRIFWIDNGDASVKSLARALGLAKAPPRVIVFFPKEFEEKLLKLEHDFRGKAERDITETRFDVRKRGDSYEPVVVTQD